MRRSARAAARATPSSSRSDLIGALLAGLAALVLAPGALRSRARTSRSTSGSPRWTRPSSGASTGERAVPAGFVYSFVVDQNVKGPIGREVDVRAAQRLVDATDKPIVHDEALGVLANLSGAELTTESCLLSRPRHAPRDERRAARQRIKVVVGLVILAAVLAYSIRRLRHRRAELAARGRLGR